MPDFLRNSPGEQVKQESAPPPKQLEQVEWHKLHRPEYPILPVGHVVTQEVPSR